MKTIHPCLYIELFNSLYTHYDTAKKGQKNYTCEGKAIIAFWLMEMTSGSHEKPELPFLQAHSLFSKVLRQKADQILVRKVHTIQQRFELISRRNVFTSVNICLTSVELSLAGSIWC